MERSVPGSGGEYSPNNSYGGGQGGGQVEYPHGTPSPTRRPPGTPEPVRYGDYTFAEAADRLSKTRTGYSLPPSRPPFVVSRQLVRDCSYRPKWEETFMYRRYIAHHPPARPSMAQNSGNFRPSSPASPPNAPRPSQQQPSYPQGGLAGYPPPPQGYPPQGYPPQGYPPQQQGYGGPPPPVYPRPGPSGQASYDLPGNVQLTQGQNGGVGVNATTPGGVRVSQGPEGGPVSVQTPAYNVGGAQVSTGTGGTTVVAPGGLTFKN